MSSKRIIVTGGAGMLGTTLLTVYSGKYKCFAIDKMASSGIDDAEWFECDLTDEKAVRRILNLVHPDLIIHCAALVSVDMCEQNRDGAYALHVRATESLASECRDRDIPMVYISTDSVFNGRKTGAYNEDDVPDPLNVYARTKLEGERPVLGIRKGLVLRTNIFGWTSHGRSFSEWVLDGLRNRKKMTMFTDVFFSPISTYGLAEIIDLCMEKEAYGLYHAGGGDTLSKHEFAVQVAVAYGLPADCLEPVVLRDVPLAAERPPNMALDSSRLSSTLGMKPISVQASINLWRKFEPKRENRRGTH